MAEQANVRSIDAIADFRAVLIGYMDSIRTITSDAKTQVTRMQHWVSETQKIEWTRRKKKCHQQLTNARSDLERAKIARHDAHPSMFTDQIRGVERAKQNLAHCESKLVAVARWTRELEREGMLFQGSLQRLSRVVDGDLERCTAWMASLISHLEAYLKTAPPDLPTADTIELDPSTRGKHGSDQTTTGDPADEHGPEVESEHSSNQPSPGDEGPVNPLDPDD